MAKRKQTRSEVAAWVRSELDGRDAISLPSLANKAVRHFSKDQVFVQAFLTENLREMIYELAGNTVRATHIRMGDQLVTPAEVEERAEKLTRKSGWESWLEHTGTRHVRLMEMTADDLAGAILQRQKRVDTEVGIINLWSAIKMQLEPGEKVGDRFTTADIDRIKASLSGGDSIMKVAA